VIREAVWDPSDGDTPCTACNKVTRFSPEIAELGHVLSLEDSEGCDPD
jgi:hypothetical protein